MTLKKRPAKDGKGGSSKGHRPSTKGAAPPSMPRKPSSFKGGGNKGGSGKGKPK